MFVLNVDDDFDDREMFCEAVKSIDAFISCIQLESGNKALDFLSKAQEMPDLIFIDINMPKMDGYEFVDKVRLLPGIINSSIVMYSTTFNPRDVENFSKLGVHYLIKSSRFSDLVNALKSLFSHSPSILLESKSRR